MRILLVEDNSSDAKILMDLMEHEKQPPNILWLTDGYKALDYILSLNGHLSQYPDIVLLDLGLPRITGYDVLLKLKLHPVFGHIPVVVLTTSRSPLDLNQCMTLGCSEALSKPPNLSGYMELVEKMINHDFPELVKKSKQSYKKAAH